MPDYQGLGIGSYLANYVGGSYRKAGYRYFTKTINPGLGEYRNRHPELWRPTSSNGKIRPPRKKEANFASHWSVRRMKCYSHEFIGDGIGDLRILKDEDGQQTLF
jgi:hypothetical protein